MYMYNLNIFWCNGIFKIKIIIPHRNVELAVVVVHGTTEFVKHRKGFRVVNCGNVLSLGSSFKEIPM
jgi:hypothetical protein